MHLRSIALQGFKTFAQRTVVGFEGGVTAVVGPNGSGKSNIVDAFKWVLGEARAKDLRGSKMEEVIYAGGARRARASGAEVTLVIDNSDGRLPVDYEEVAIRRRVDRSGHSDYFLNDSRVRRRDLLDLLASTGLTTDSYAIVDQGDIEGIIASTPEQRRLLIEEAAQVRGVKAKRTEAAGQLRELAGNLSRLQDLRGEIEPRLEVVRAQAETFREAEEARRRLELLRGSIAWEEWREARDAHRKASNQAQSLQRKLDEAKQAAEAAEAEWRSRKEAMQAAQDRRLQRQQEIGTARLDLSNAEHQLSLTEERVRSQAAMVEAARSEEAELASRVQAADERLQQLRQDVGAAEQELEKVPQPPSPPAAGDADEARAAGRDAQAAQRELRNAEQALTSTRSRIQVLEDTVSKLEAQVLPAEEGLAEAEQASGEAKEQARIAAAAAAELAKLRAELDGLESLRPSPTAQLRRVGDVIIADAGYEAALAAVLGPLVDAWAAPDEAAAASAARESESQATVLYPTGDAPVEDSSLAGHVRTDPGFEQLARRLLGSVVLGRDVTEDGTYREPGLVRAGEDPRTRVAARRRRLENRIAELEPEAARAAAADEAVRQAQSRLGELGAAAGQRRRLDESAAQLEEARARETAEAGRITERERAAADAEQRAQELAQAIDEHERRVAEHRAEVQRLELERAHWKERVQDVRRQLAAAERDRESLERARQARERRAADADRQVQEGGEAVPSLRSAVETARERLAGAERESPEEEAGMADAAHSLVAAEEARVDARLKVSTLSGNLELTEREVQLSATRMEELRARMPEGLAPEEVPGGKAREREMRQLERRLTEIGPTNPLAEQECSELEERYGTLLRQLEDITAARDDLERLIEQLRDEEETRYDAVFGAVVANFQEFYGELTAGGKCTLRQVEGDDGPRSGVEILVQPPRKRMQQVTMLSSGERSLTSLALVMALQAVNPAPFTIFDEVDAALDDANVGRFGEVMQRLGAERQFMVITHNHTTMACCASLYGVHLDESGGSHLVSVRLEDLAPARKRGKVGAAQPA